MANDQVSLYGNQLYFGRSPANGELLIGNGLNFVLSPITAGSNITVTNSAGGITIAAPNTGYVQNNVTTTFTVGYTFTAYNAGTISSGTFNINPALGNYQYLTNNATGSAFNWAAPTVDCAVDFLLTNASSGTLIAPNFVGQGWTYAVGNTGDNITTTNNSKFIVSTRRINGVSTFVVKALQ